MGYEYRNFKRINHAMIEGSDLIDFYVSKYGFINIGVKLRNPTPKEYGWKIKSFEVKVSTTPQHQFCKKPQKWHKFVFGCDHKLKWLDKSKEELQAKFVKLNKWISESLLANVQKITLEIGVNQQQIRETIKRWIQSDIMQVFMICKDKVKAGNIEKGRLCIEGIMNKGQKLYHETIAEQHNKKQKFSNTLTQPNISYPQLLQQIIKQHEALNTSQCYQKQEYKPNQIQSKLQNDC